ncbi:TPA: hypothetical protein DCZ39_03380 [Patescibacteria group bacterium]|nr:hypothetical protein [Candidatus Gracilibacteria bacterium]
MDYFVFLAAALLTAVFSIAFFTPDLGDLSAFSFFATTFTVFFSALTAFSALAEATFLATTFFISFFSAVVLIFNFQTLDFLSFTTAIGAFLEAE